MVYICREKAARPLLREDFDKLLVYDPTQSLVLANMVRVLLTGQSASSENCSRYNLLINNIGGNGFIASHVLDLLLLRGYLPLWI
jgi:hypothetical protein